MELLRTSLKTHITTQHKTGPARSGSIDSCGEPGDFYKPESVRSAAVCNIVQTIHRSTFDDLCHIYPCDGDLSQRSDDINESEQSRIDLAAKIDCLCTADVVNVILQPQVLDIIVSELQNGFLLK